MKPRNPIARVVRTIRPPRIPDKRRLLHDRATAKSISEYPPVRTRARENQHKVKS